MNAANQSVTRVMRVFEPNELLDPVIAVRGVDHAFGEGETRKQVLFSNELEVYPGELVIMTGPSGSGKTTLLTLIGALRSVQSGSLEVLGQDLARATPQEQLEHRRRVGFIFQGHNLFPALSALDNVRLALDHAPLAPAEKTRRAREILIQLGLEERIHAKPQQLSGGQKQRVAIARALVGKPPIVLADEPTAALDTESGRDVVDLLRTMVSEHQSTILMVTHDNRILDVADRVISMVDGRIVADVNVQESLKICEFLTRCSFFADRSPQVLQDLAGRMKRERFSPGGTIVQQGAEGDRFYIVRSGSVEVEQGEEGSSKILATLAEGDFFGEVALLRNAPRNATVRALEPVELYSLDKPTFEQVVADSRDFREQLRATLFQRTH